MSTLGGSSGAATLIAAWGYGGWTDGNWVNGRESHGYYWSSTRNYGPNAYYLYYTSSSLDVSSMGEASYGFQIRCVK